MSTGQISNTPLDRIALCCSGGGYRAASFHLGAMTYLHRVPYQNGSLLDRVKAISTVSGGTIVGVVYAMQRQQGKSFEEFYNFFIEKLKSIDLVRLGLAKLNEDAPWSNMHKRKNLINAFAEIYDEHFTQGETFDVFDNMSNSHLEEVIFNATEFNKGLIFRFQNDGRFGNYYFPVKKAIAGAVKLADIIAASSCFTGGFEPIEWPADFIHAESVELKEEAPMMTNVGLMDGGIYDNQGIDSILLSETRVGAIPFDLIIVSDVTSPYLRAFKFMEAKETPGWRDWNLKRLGSWAKKKFNLIKGAAILVMLAGFGFLISNPISGSTLAGIVIAALMLAVSVLIFLFWIRSRLHKLLADAATYFAKELSDDLPLDDLQSLKFSSIQFRRLEPLIVDRINSLFTLVGSIFLKTVRRLVYGRIYNSEKHQFRRAGNLIRQLTREDFEQRQERNLKDPLYYQNLPGCPEVLLGDYDQVVGGKLASITERAASFGTTLWFSESEMVNEMLEALLISGQASMCFSLLKHLTEIKYTAGNGYDDLPDTQREDLEQVWQQCLEDWVHIKENPKFLLSTI